MNDAIPVLEDFLQDTRSWYGPNEGSNRYIKKMKIARESQDNPYYITSKTNSDMYMNVQPFPHEEAKKRLQGKIMKRYTNANGISLPRGKPGAGTLGFNFYSQDQAKMDFIKKLGENYTSFDEGRKRYSEKLMDIDSFNHVMPMPPLYMDQYNEQNIEDRQWYENILKGTELADQIIETTDKGIETLGRGKELLSGDLEITAGISEKKDIKPYLMGAGALVVLIAVILIATKKKKK
jgi:hypothetical protein